MTIANSIEGDGLANDSRHWEKPPPDIAKDRQSCGEDVHVPRSWTIQSQVSCKNQFSIPHVDDEF